MALTTTQRRLKRLADAGLIERLQFHRRDGGGAPMCHRPSGRAQDLLRERGYEPFGTARSVAGGADRSPGRPSASGSPTQLRHQLHVAGWVLAAGREIDDPSELVGEDGSVLFPPRGASSSQVLGPVDLRLADGRVPHDFVVPGPGGVLVEAERFETVRPDARLACGRLDLLVELDDRLRGEGIARKLLRYDHFLSGWSVHTSRYGGRADRTPITVFICRSRERAAALARLADMLLRACRAYPGEYPFAWEYPGRERMLFVSERDAHEGCLGGFGVPSLPPHVRAQAHGADPAAVQPEAAARELVLTAEAARAEKV
jgi:hypothetical protein